MLQILIIPTPRDRDQDKKPDGSCARKYGGGWWYNNCFKVHLTGQHTESKMDLASGKHIYYFYGGARGNSRFSWKEAEMLLIPH